MDNELDILGNIKSNIKTLRKAQGYSTQQQFADALGVNLKSVQGWEKEKDHRMIDTRNLILICNTLKCDLDFLTGRIPEKTHDLNTVCEITGLSENAVDWIINLDPSRKTAFDHFIQHYEFEKMMDSYSLFLKMLDNASKRFVPGTPGASIGIGMDEEISIEKDGTVIVSSLWQILSLIGHDVGFNAQLITDNDRMTLWGSED